jgi:hypothetical protein
VIIISLHPPKRKKKERKRFPPPGSLLHEELKLSGAIRGAGALQDDNRWWQASERVFWGCPVRERRWSLLLFLVVGI